jgi:UDP-N-acetylmuramoylalanine--D-glutamate ligase
MEQSLAGRRVTVMGLGIFGAQIAAVRFLAGAGADVTVTDLRPAEVLQASLEQIADLPHVRLRLGGHQQPDFVETDLLVVSPAVRPDNPFVQSARSAGIRVTSEIRLFWDRCQAPIVGVTGSNGKSTTATLIRDILAADGRRVWLGGNIGRSLLLQTGEIAAGDWVVLELSSFQLADLNLDRRSPRVAVITNVSPNHLDWHGSQQSYVHAKQTLLRWQEPDDLVVRRRGTHEADWPAHGHCLWCSEQEAAGLMTRLDREGGTLHLLPRHEAINVAQCPGLAGAHLQTAALLAATAGLGLEVSTIAIRTALQNFSGLPHRLQECGRWQGRRLINDSASTTPESTIAALQCLDALPVLIAGGAEKGSALSPLARAIARHARGAILIGDVRQKLTGELEMLCTGDGQRSGTLEFLLQADTLAEAVQQARQHSRAGETILFSPGFASGSMFRNFEHRGEMFVALATSPTAAEPPVASPSTAP